MAAFQNDTFGARSELTPFYVFRINPRSVVIAKVALKSGPGAPFECIQAFSRLIPSGFYMLSSDRRIP